MHSIIAPSVLASDFSNLQNEIEMLNKSEADWIHVDIMDGVFVPNISFGIPVCKAIAKHAKKPLDVHLMIVNPENFVEKFKEAGAEIITVHYEACKHLHRNIQQIRSLGCKVGISINPHTSVDLLENVINDIDLVLIMSVNPGFGGQKFIDNTFEKIVKLKKLIDTSGSNAIIEIDGGVNLNNAKPILEAGATALVAGSFVFKSPDPVKTIHDLKHV